MSANQYVEGEAMKPWQGDVVLHPQEILTDKQRLHREAKRQKLAECREIESWLDNRPSASMDPSLDKRVSNIRRQAELKSVKRTTVRPPTKMMDAQQMSEFDFEDLP